jgi:hypothetical protein
MKKLLVTFAVLVVAQAAPFRVGAQQSRSRTHDVVVSGMTCKQQGSSNSLECAYRVGRSLYFTIAGVGDPDAGITFMSSSFDGDYYATFGILHGCVIVKPGKLQSNPFDFAFVSPRNGKVYGDWESCRAAK